MTFIALPVAAQDRRDHQARATYPRASTHRRWRPWKAISPHATRRRRTAGVRPDALLGWALRGRPGGAATGLTQTPEYKDARVALMNVAWWSGRTAEASDLAAQLLTRDPGDPQARLMRHASTHVHVPGT